MGSKEKIEVEVSFSTSLKFWLAFLITLIVAMIIAFAIFLVLLILIRQWIISQLPIRFALSFLFRL
ncbi:MAG: hypothetical protein QXF59_05615 [Candidatus Bathyarchaeia archaeon]|nr:hypothetical protein [Candidatus Bathyarchaeota archaeon]